MKKLSVVVLFLIMLIGLAACQTATAEPTATLVPPTATPPATFTPAPPTITPTPTAGPLPALNSPDGPPLRVLKMFSAKDGWGLIADSLLVTHNGGVNWYSVPLPGGQVDPTSAIFLLDINNIYLVVPAPGKTGGLLYRTTDGGGTWKSSPVPFVHGDLTVKFNVAYFMEITDSAAASDEINMYLSVDYGATWIKTYSSASAGLPEKGLKTGFGYINVDRGWFGVAGQDQKIQLYRTEDTGNTWKLQQIQEPENISSLKTSVQAPFFFADNELDGILSVDFLSKDGSESNRVFYVTSDGGTTWIPGSSVTDGAAYTFLNPKTGWVWGKGGIYFTQDGGQTWQLRPVAFGRSEHATCLSFIDANTGWMLTADAKNRVRIYITNDGGSTWMSLNQ